MPLDAVTVYADYACPFCYLGRNSLERYRETREEPLDVEWHPFDLLADRRGEDGQLRPPSRDDGYFEEAWRNVEQLAAEYDVPVPDGPITDVDSLPAQQLSFFVQQDRPDAWEALDVAMYEALWQDERDVGDRDVLVDVATEVGLDESVVDDVLSDERRRTRLEERFDEARRHGITGVPTFVAGEHAARGAVPPEQLRRLVEGSD